MIHICFTCDKENCKNAQNAGFDKKDETYGDLITAMQQVGWHIEDGITICPACNKKTTTTAIYPNRTEDKIELESILGLSEFGDTNTKFYLASGTLFATGYNRIVYGDHGPYIEFSKNNIEAALKSKFNNYIDFDNLPTNNKYYYFWLYPETDPNIKVYLQLKPVSDLPNAPHRFDGKKSAFNRKEGYADYKRGYFYVDPYALSTYNKQDKC